MNLSEAEIQLLAILQAAELENNPSDRGSLDKQGERYGDYLEDWSRAYSSLATKGLIEGDERAYRLTEVGRPLAYRYYQQRPDRYWYYYQQFYQAAHASKAHSRFCERVYGKDLCQEGQTDMDCLDELLDCLELKPGQHVLDLGCGAGGISEYISDRTGVKVTGMDNSAPAIATADARTENKRTRLNFLQADMNALAFPANSFDAAISLDTLYWVADLSQSISSIVRSIKPGGHFGIFIEQTLAEGDNPEVLKGNKTEVAQALEKLKLDYQVRDYTTEFGKFWSQARDVALDLRDEFESEGNGFISQNWIREAEDEFLPALKDNKIRRYCYLVSL
ncbi:MAG: class I SAM-dependent methyltransferase [Gammaproteobacteria bacterium]